MKSNLLTFIRDNKQYNNNNQTLTGLPTPSNSTTDTTQQDK